MQARDAQAMMAHPSDGTFKHLVSSTNAVCNLDVSIPAIANANSLFGPDLGGVRGKTAAYLCLGRRGAGHRRGLVEEDTAHRDIPAEFPGIELESDCTDEAVEADPVTLEWQLAEQVLANANLSSTNGEHELTGVDLPDAHAPLFGEGGRKAVTAKLTQMHDMATYTPMHAHELTREQRVQALSLLMFLILTQKRDGRTKGQACANGSKQRGYIDKESATSPTVSTDSLMITAAVDAVELRDIVTLDILGAFLHADLDEDMIMVLRGELAELMAKVKPKLYRPYIVTTLQGESILYVKMQKAMYGLLRSALLFYLKLRRDLEAFGFVVNDYNPCVANKIVNGMQMTVMWHVDDLKVSHRDGKKITKLLVYLGQIYGPGITVNRGRRHDYLGIDFDFSEDGVAHLTMTKHLEKIFEDFPEEIGKECTLPASEHLFEVRDPEETERLRKYLPEELAQHFHHTVAQLLYIGTRVRRDIQTAVAFLTTRVKRPDKDDWGKLKRVLKYLKGTKHEPYPKRRRHERDQMGDETAFPNGLQKTFEIGQTYLNELEKEYDSLLKGMEDTDENGRRSLHLDDAWNNVLRYKGGESEGTSLLEDMDAEPEAKRQKVETQQYPMVICSRVLLTPGQCVISSIVPVLKRKRATLIRNKTMSYVRLEFGNAFEMNIYFTPLLVTVRAMERPKERQWPNMVTMAGELTRPSLHQGLRPSLGSDGTSKDDGKDNKDLTVLGVTGPYSTLGHMITKKLQYASAQATHILRRCFAKTTVGKGALAKSDFEVEILEIGASVKFLQIARSTYIPDWVDDD
eukprot:CCRYP_018676-RA/>CCRYP_018676-RA protein AED:0.47 eAED:0.17 QI:0/0/0/0.75/0.33/0.25/4/0/800